MLVDDHSYYWSEWIKIISFLDHIQVLKLLFFISVVLIYPLIWLRNRYVNAESTSWVKVMLITENIGTFIARIIFILFIIMTLYFIIRAIS